MRNIILATYCWFVNRKILTTSTSPVSTTSLRENIAGLMIHRFQQAKIFGDPEEYEEHTDIGTCLSRVKELAARADGFEYWAEDDTGNIYHADEHCAYCGSSQNPNDICFDCFDNLT